MDIETTIDDVYAKYNELYIFWQNMESLEGLSQQILNQKIQEFKVVETKIISEGVISPNEEFEELLPETLKFLTMPIILGDLYTRKQDNRSDWLNKAEFQYHQFLKLMSHYHICPNNLERMFEKIRESPKYQTTRDEKISLFKDTKIVADELEVAKGKYLQEGPGANPQKYMRLFLVSLCYKSIDMLKYLPQEKEMLAFRKKLETDPEAKAKYDEECAKPIPKLQSQRIDSTSIGKEEQMAIQIQKEAAMRESNPAEYMRRLQENGNTGEPWSEFQIPKHIPIALNPNGFDARGDRMGKVFQPDHAQPVMTLETHGNIEYSLMCEKHKAQEESGKLEKAYMNSLSSEQHDDIDTMKNRNWDDWKDENEKGAGNRMNKHGAT